MFSTPSMVDMRRTPEEKTEASMPMAYACDYPYGLCISLGKDELEKLEVDFDSVEVGETYHLFILAKVTAKSKHENETSEDSERIELQITHMGAESENAEDDESEAEEPVHKKMYKK